MKIEELNEIVKVLSNAFAKCDGCDDCPYHDFKDEVCEKYLFAEALYDAGYRKIVDSTSDRRTL
jgi:hypothetical protein